jgi:hypothetical protein
LTKKILDLTKLERQIEFMDIGGQLGNPIEDIKNLYIKLISEELSELDEALNEKFFTVKELSESDFHPSVDELDALADILVVSAGFYAKDDMLPGVLGEEDSILDLHVNNEDKQVLLFDTLMSLQSMAAALKSDLLKPDFDYNDWNEAIPALILSVVMVTKIYNLDIEAVMTEVYDSNFSKFITNPETGKLEAQRNDYGKIMKGPNFRLPNFEQFIKREVIDVTEHSESIN